MSGTSGGLYSLPTLMEDRRDGIEALVVDTSRLFSFRLINFFFLQAILTNQQFA